VVSNLVDPGGGGIDANAGDAAAANRRLGFRHCDPRAPFLWQSADQPPARWHGSGEGPANYFADTPVGAWGEFLRHEGITDAADLAGVRRSLWVVELPADTPAVPQLTPAVLHGDDDTYPACQAEARRLRAAGATSLEAPAAALLPGGASGWSSNVAGLVTGQPARDGRVWVIFGPLAATGWVAVQAGAPPAQVLPLVRQFGVQA
jgi:hypothetical protein